jgi:hypothetical protein
MIIMTSDPQSPPPEADRESLRTQVGMAMASLAAAFADTLQELFPGASPAAVLDRKVQVQLAKLRQFPDVADVADVAQILRIVRDALRNPDILPQPNDEIDD